MPVACLCWFWCACPKGIRQTPHSATEGVPSVIHAGDSLLLYVCGLFCRVRILSSGFAVKERTLAQ